MSAETKDINKDNSDMFELLTQVSKQNSDSIIKQTESIEKLTSGQVTIGKTLGEIITTLKENVHQSDNNNPVEEGLGMEQKPKVESDKDVGAKTSAPNAYAPGEYGSAGREGAEPGKDKNGLKMENKEDKPKEEEKTEDKPKEEEKTHKEDKPKEEEKTEDKPKEEANKEEKPKEETKEEEPKKEEKYKSFNYDDNTTIRPSVISKSFETYPDGYQIIKAALNGWGIEGIDADGAYSETLKRLDNYEFGTFGQVDTGAGY